MFHSQDHWDPNKPRKKSKYDGPNGAHVHDVINGKRIHAYDDGKHGRNPTKE